jgi:hypothetical protein
LVATSVAAAYSGVVFVAVAGLTGAEPRMGQSAERIITDFDRDR